MKHISSNTIVNLIILTTFLCMSLVLTSCGSNDDNSQPEIDPIAGQTLDVGEKTEVELKIIDADTDDKHEVSVSSDNTNVNIDLITVKTFTITGITRGISTITVIVMDNSREDNAESIPVEFKVTVRDSTQPNVGKPFDIDTPEQPSDIDTPEQPSFVEAHDSVTISEIMYAAEARFTPPQWIELHNASTETISLRGWTVTIQNQNTPDLTNLNNVSVEFTFEDDFWGDAPTLWPNETVLIASSDVFDKVNTTDLGENQIYDLRWRTKLDFGLWDTMLSVEAFSIKLTDNGGYLIDEVGNFDGNTRLWQFDLAHRGKTRDGFRCSVIRRYNNGTELDGTQKNSWVLAENANLNENLHTYYGDKNDISSPGIPPDIGQ